MKRLAGLALVLGLLAGKTNAADVPCSAAQLQRMSRCELEQLYRGLSPGKVPCGYLPGKSIYCSRLRSNSTNLAWKGKHFCGGTMINQWVGFRAVEARVYVGESWLDGKPSIILDYRGRSGMWSDVRDEIREVAPGLFLGIMCRERCTGAKRETFFVLGCP